MLHDFLTTNRSTLIDRCRGMVANRSDPKVAELELAHGIPIFLDQLIKTLTIEESLESNGSHFACSDGRNGSVTEVEGMAAQHGRDLLNQGFTIEQVVRDYGDVCQAVTNLAAEKGAPISVHEFRTFNRCLDNAIVGAVSEYARQSTPSDDSGVQLLNTRLGPLAHELRNYLHTATLVVAAIKAGNVGISGATAAVLDRSLLGMRNLIDRSLAEVRVTAGMPPRMASLVLAKFIGEVEVSAALDARARGCQFTVTPVDESINIYADSEMLAAALGNLLHNAFKFTKRHTDVWLDAYAVEDRVLIDVEDHCGGLSKGASGTLASPFAQDGEDRSGLGLGLGICRRSVEAINGSLKIRDVPGSGCIFTIDLPRHR